MIQPESSGICPEITIWLEIRTSTLTAVSAVYWAHAGDRNPALNIIISLFSGQNVMDAVPFLLFPGAQQVSHAPFPQIEARVLLMLQLLVLPVALGLVGKLVRGQGEHPALLFQDVDDFAGPESAQFVEVGSGGDLTKVEPLHILTNDDIGLIDQLDDAFYETFVIVDVSAPTIVHVHDLVTADPFGRPCADCPVAHKELQWYIDFSQLPRINEAGEVFDVKTENFQL